MQWAWLASSAAWVRLPLLPACRSGFLHAMRLNSQAGTEGSPVSSYKCDMPSHPDWGRLGVVRASGVDNRDGRGQWSYRRAALWHPAREPRQLRCTLEIYSTSPRVREKMHWARPRPHAGSGWRHVKKLPTFYRHPWQNERTNLRHCHCLPFSIYGFVLHKSRMHPFMAWLWFHKCR